MGGEKVGVEMSGEGGIVIDGEEEGEDGWECEEAGRAQ